MSIQRKCQGGFVGVRDTAYIWFSSFFPPLSAEIQDPVGLGQGFLTFVCVMDNFAHIIEPVDTTQKYVFKYIKIM